MTTVRLPSSCDVRECAVLKQLLLPLLESPQAVAVDVAEVQRADISGLQLLLAFARDRAISGLSTQWQGDSPALRSAATALNLDIGNRH